MNKIIKTKNCRKHMAKGGTIDLCRECHLPGESLRHIVSICSHLANREYLHKHNKVARIIHQELASKYSLVEKEVPYYSCNSASVLKSGQVLLYWGRYFINDRCIIANKPDIVVVDSSARRAMVVD